MRFFAAVLLLLQLIKAAIYTTASQAMRPGSITCYIMRGCRPCLFNNNNITCKSWYFLAYAWWWSKQNGEHESSRISAYLQPATSWVLYFLLLHRCSFWHVRAPLPTVFQPLESLSWIRSRDPMPEHFEARGVRSARVSATDRDHK